MIAVPDAGAFELGFIPAVAAILSLGPQNTLVLRHGLSGRNIPLVVGTCFGCDLSLLLFAVTGLGAVMAAWPTGLLMLQASGAAYLALMSARCFAKAMLEKHAKPDGMNGCARRVVLAALAVSLCNPLAWIESVLIIGALSSTVGSNLAMVFAMGAALGSLSKFSALGFGARILRPLFRWPAFRRTFDAVAGTVMAGMAVTLLMRLAA